MSDPSAKEKAAKFLDAAREAASKLIVGHELKEEIAQKAVFNALLAGSEIENPAAYFRSTVQRLAYAEHRRPASAQLNDTLEDSAPSPEFTTEAVDLKNKIERLLTPDEVNLITRAFVDGCSTRDIAEERRVSIRTVQLHLQQILRFLRSQL